MGAGDHNNHLKKSHMTPAGPSDWSVFFPQPEQPLMGPLMASTAIFEYVPVQKMQTNRKKCPNGEIRTYVTVHGRESILRH